MSTTTTEELRSRGGGVGAGGGKVTGWFHMDLDNAEELQKYDPDDSDDSFDEDGDDDDNVAYHSRGSFTNLNLSVKGQKLKQEMMDEDGIDIDDDDVDVGGGYAGVDGRNYNRQMKPEAYSITYTPLTLKTAQDLFDTLKIRPEAGFPEGARAVVEDIAYLDSGITNSCYKVSLSFSTTARTMTSSPSTTVTTTVTTRLSAKTVVLKVAPSQTVRVLRYESLVGGSLLRMEKDVLDALHDTTTDGNRNSLRDEVRRVLPRVLGFDETRRVVPSEVLVLSYLPGITLRAARRLWGKKYTSAKSEEGKAKIVNRARAVDVEVGRLLKALSEFNPPRSADSETHTSSTPRVRTDAMRECSSRTLINSRLWGLLTSHAEQRFPRRNYTHLSQWYVEHIESLLGDGEDMRILLPYAEIRRCIGRWKQFLDQPHHHIHHHHHPQNPPGVDGVTPEGEITPKFMVLDLSPTSILVDQCSGKVTGIIDFERAMWGDPLAQMIAIVAPCDGFEDAGGGGGGSGIGIGSGSASGSGEGVRLDTREKEAGREQPGEVVFPHACLLGEGHLNLTGPEEIWRRRCKQLLYLILHSITGILSTYYRTPGKQIEEMQARKLLMMALVELEKYDANAHAEVAKI